MSKIKIAINGFGRIGRMFLRVAHANQNFDIVAINDVMEPYTMAHLLKYDSVHKRFDGLVEFNHNHIEVNGKKTTLDVGNYHLPVSFGGVQIDCSLTLGYYSNTNQRYR